MTFDEVADELYGLTPGEFIAARVARVAEARRDDDPGLADAVKQLKKPTVSAWLANLLVRERPEEVGQLLELGETIREAQQRLAGDELRSLAGRRHQVVTAVASEARRVAREAGQAVSDATVGELEGTLDAALSDPAVADAVRQGRLTTALHYAGLGFAQGAVVAPPTTGRKAARPSRPAAGGGQSGDGAEEAARREAEQAAEEAIRLRAARSSELEEAERAVGELREQVVTAEAQLVALREQLKDATRDATRARKERDAATVAERRAGDALAALKTKGST